MKLTKINLNKQNRMIRIGFGKHGVSLTNGTH